MENLTDDALLNFLDNNGSEAEKERVKNLVNTNSALKRRMQELEAVHIFLQNQSVIDQPTKNFTEKVMARLHTQPTFAFLSPKNGLLLLLGLMVASGLAVVLTSSGVFDQWHTFFNLGPLPLKNNWMKLPTSVPFDLKLIVKVFVMLNIVIGFVLLDQTILRPIFQKRRSGSV